MFSSAPRRSRLIHSRLRRLRVPSLTPTLSLPLEAEGVPPYAVFSIFNPSSAIVASRILNFWILPVTVIGKPSTKRT